MKFILLSFLLFLTYESFSQKIYIDSDSNGYWKYQEMVKYDTAKIDSPSIIDHLTQWFNTKKTVFNSSIAMDTYKLGDNIVGIDSALIKGYIHGALSRTGTHKYIIRLYITVEILEDKYKITFSDLTPLSSTTLGILHPFENPTPFKLEEVKRTFKKKKGDTSLDGTIERLIEQIKTEVQK